MNFFKKLISNLKENKSVKSLAFFIVDLPIIRSVYKKIYLNRINNIVKNKKIDTLTIEPFNVCNLRCVMCPYTKMTRPKVQMSMKLFKKIIDEAADIGIKKISFTSYNEAFLDNLLFERIKYAKKKNMYVSFFSNGTVLTQDKIKKLLKSPPDLLTFSFDSNVKETYEQIRTGANFEKTRNNILNLIKERNRLKLKKPFIKIHMIHMDLNHAEIKDFINFWEKRADGVEFGSVDNRVDNYSKLKLSGKGDSQTIYPCWGAFYDWGVLSDGRVTFCECQDYDGKYVVGNVNKNTLNEILHSKKYEEYRKLHLKCQGDKMPICKKCTYLHKSVFGWW